MISFVESLGARRLMSALIQDADWNFLDEDWINDDVVGAQPDGKLIAVKTVFDPPEYTSENHFLTTSLERINPDGSIDTSYANPVLIHRTQEYFTEFAAIDGQGRITILKESRFADVGQTTGFTLTRYTLDGEIDRTFANQGTLLLGGFSGNTIENFQFFKANQKGQLLLFGWYRNSSDNTVNFATRITEDGAIDPGFGDGGFTIIKQYGYGNNPIFADDGSVYLIDNQSSYQHGLLVLTKKGRGDRRYGPGGEFAFPKAFRDGLTSVLTVDKQGRIYMIIGERPVRLAPNNKMPAGLVPRSIARINRDGSIDRSYGANGFVSLDTKDGFKRIYNYILNYQLPTNALIDDQNRLMLGLYDQTIRLTPDGQYDTSFDFDGISDEGFPVDLIKDNYIYSYRGYIHRYKLAEPIELDSTGRLVIAATHSNTILRIDQTEDKIRVRFDDIDQRFKLKKVKSIEVHLSDGNDVLRDFSDRPITVQAGDGNDFLRITRAPNVIGTGNGNDTFVGGAGSDSITNAGGHDIIRAGSGELFVRSDAAGYKTSDGSFVGIASASVSGDFRDNEHVKLRLGWLDDHARIVGGRVSVEDFGSEIENVFNLRTRAGASASFGNGRTLLDTGDGDDTISAGYGPIRVNSHGGNDVLGGGSWIIGDPRHLTDIQPDTINTGDGNDTIFGSTMNDLILAGAGDDVIYGRDGKDTINGGDGNDQCDEIDDDILTSIEGPILA